MSTSGTAAGGMPSAPGRGLLHGLRVLDLSVWRPGPYATQLLAEIGADVLKVEPPGGDPMRGYPQIFASLSANKRSIAVDLKTAPGRDRVLELAAEADVFVEGFRPGVVQRLGVDYETVRSLNEAIVYCSVSGMGQSGPLTLAPGHDLNYLAWAGALAPDGGPPVAPAIPVADLAGGMTAAFAILAAVVRRQSTGEGERIDVAMADVLATWTGAAEPQADGVDAGARGVPGYGVFTTADGGSIALGVLTEDHFWRALCATVGLPTEASLTFPERMARVAVLQGQLAAAIAGRERDDLLADLLAADVPAAPVHDRAGMLEEAHFRDRGVVTDDPWASPTTGYPVRFEQHAAHRYAAPPGLDEHRGSGFLERP